MQKSNQQYILRTRVPHALLAAIERGGFRSLSWMEAGRRQKFKDYWNSYFLPHREAK
jgi:hypothetical protein